MLALQIGQLDVAGRARLVLVDELGARGDERVVGVWGAGMAGGVAGGDASIQRQQLGAGVGEPLPRDAEVLAQFAVLLLSGGGESVDVEFVAEGATGSVRPRGRPISLWCGGAGGAAEFGAGGADGVVEADFRDAADHALRDLLWSLPGRCGRWR